MATWRKCCNFIIKQIIGQYPSNREESECLYVGFIQLNGGGGLADYTLDDNTTPLLNDAYGNGYLKTLMQSQQGDAYALINDSANFISNGIHVYYVGTSANNIDVNFLGSYFGTIYFTPLSDNGIECRPFSCYTMTFPVGYNNLAIFQFSFAPLTPIATEINSSAPLYNYINVTNVVDMTTLINQIYGNSAVYSIVDNLDGTYTMTITNAYYFGSNPSLILLNSRFESYTDTMTDC
jgi:hypothetical protein